MPRPVMMRMTMRPCSVVKEGVTSEKMPNSARQVTIMLRRPKRSASGPKIIEPNIMPNTPAESAGASAAPGIFQAFTSAGAA
jgi:hypothetical protein